MAPPRDRTRLVVAGVVLVLVALGARRALAGLQLGQIGAELRAASPLLLLLAALAALSMQVTRAWFWKLTLRQGRQISFRHLLRYNVLGSASSVLLPARAGEAVRVWLLGELERVPATDAIGAALAERALDLVSMVLMVAPLPLLLPRVPTWVVRAEVVLCAVAVTLVVLLAVLARRGHRGTGWLAKLGGALSTLRSAPRFCAALATMFLGWVADVATLLLVAKALHLSLPAAAPLLVLLSVNLAIAVPAAPAQLGTHEAGTLVALSLLGVGNASAVGFALVYHAAHVIPLLLVGALDAPLLLRAIRRR